MNLLLCFVFVWKVSECKGNLFFIVQKVAKVILGAIRLSFFEKLRLKYKFYFFKHEFHEFSGFVF